MKSTKIPERMCVACRQMKPKSDLLRIVVGIEPQIDLSGKINGRGVYICKSKQCLDKARKNKGFTKAYGFSIDKIADELESLIEQ